MRVLLVDVDSKIPNLALMKLSSWHRAQGDDVRLMRGLRPELPLDCLDPQVAYISCIFEKNGERAVRFANNLRSLGITVSIGGAGIGPKSLSDDVEHQMPDYDLYNVRYSMGYTSRGCIRTCPWCRVRKVEGGIREHAEIKEFLSTHHDKLVLLDGNFLASPNAVDKLGELARRKVRVNFSQGLDIRLVTSEVAKLLTHVWYYDGRFKDRRLHFAFDLPELEDQVVGGIKTLEDNGIPRIHLMFYVLVGFNTTYEEDLRRVKLLIANGVKPYIMCYNNRRDGYKKHLSRWVNGRFYRDMVPIWEEYDHGDSKAAIAQAIASAGLQ